MINKYSLQRIFIPDASNPYSLSNTVEIKWLEHLWNHENMFETGVVRANEC